MYIILLFISIILSKCCGHELKQVIVLSRHNIRTPWSQNMDSVTSKIWPTWYGNPGDLTPKGRRLERSMGKYFADWMIEEKLFDSNCPKDGVFVYANSKHRTKESAKTFVEGAFGNCVSVHFKNVTGTDPVFATIIRNSSDDFKEAVLHEMTEKLNKADLKESYLELNKVLDITKSQYCRNKSICDLSKEKSEVVLALNKEPDIFGALRIGCITVDSFLMAYYDGMALENIAWGEIQTTQQWTKLMKILNTCPPLRFAVKILDRDVASNLIEYLGNIFQNGRNKFYLLVGHDNNIISLLSSLHFKDYVLHDQFEKTPIGGKIVWQKWHDEENDRDLLRVNYVYQSTKQIRDGAEVSLQNPPQWDILEMENCAVDENGFCLWTQFINNLNRI